jgi:hypothetical protein
MSPSAKPEMINYLPYVKLLKEWVIGV